ncbi:hypothetical protein Tco_1210025 [Tanacetum coccineum]
MDVTVSIPRSILVIWNPSIWSWLSSSPSLLSSVTTRPAFNASLAHVSNDLEREVFPSMLSHCCSCVDMPGGGYRVHHMINDGLKLIMSRLTQSYRLSKLCDPSIDLSHGHSIYRADKPIIYPQNYGSLAIELFPISYLEPRVDKHNLLRGGCSDLGISSIRSTCGGMCRDGDSGGGGGDDDGSNGDGIGGGDECAGGAVHLARRSPVEGGDREIGGDGDGVVMARSLSTSASGRRDMEV